MFGIIIETEKSRQKTIKEVKEEAQSTAYLYYLNLRREARIRDLISAKKWHRQRSDIQDELVKLTAEQVKIENAREEANV